MREKNVTKKSKKGLIIFLVILSILLIIGGGLVYYVHSKINNINYEEIDKDDLEVNVNLYEEIIEESDITEEEFKDIVNIAFFGSDSRDVYNEYAGRSDSIMIASINPVKKSIKLISIPRDTYVSIPGGYGWTKINHAYAYGKEQLSIKTINSNFGLDITEYVTIDFSGLVNIINDVGGIELEINEAEKNYINKGCINSYKLTGNPVKYLSSSGKVTLTGEQALTHSRNRTVGNDFERASRQRDVLVALINKISKMDETKILSLVDVFLKEVKTNVNVTSYLGLLTSVISNKDEYLNNIISAQIPSEGYASGQMIDGIYYFVADLSRCKQEFVKYLYDM